MRLLEAELAKTAGLDDPVRKDAIARALNRQSTKMDVLQPGKVKAWRLPTKMDAEFVACMEDVLDACHRPCDAAVPVVRMNEMPFQLLRDSRVALEMRPGNDKAVDYEHTRNGTGRVFMSNESLGGRRSVSVREHRTAVELKAIVDLPRFKDAEKIIVVLDNLNTQAADPPARRSVPRRRTGSSTGWSSTTLRSTDPGSTPPNASCRC